MAERIVTLAELTAAPPALDRAKFDATTEADIRRHAIEDGEDPDAPLPTGRVVLPPAEVRRRVGMSQERFAALLGVPVGTLRNWEQGRTLPDPSARSLLNVVAREPEAALRALAAAAGQDNRDPAIADPKTA